MNTSFNDRNVRDHLQRLQIDLAYECDMLEVLTDPEVIEKCKQHILELQYTISKMEEFLG